MKRVILPSICFIITAYVGCKPRLAEQATVEAQAAASLRTTLVLYENEFPNIKVTNVAQLFENPSNLAQGYPHFLDKAFRSYGSNAGFSNSFYEKYLVVSAGLRHRYLTGEVVLLNAKPFPNREGELGRMIVSKTGPGHEGTHVGWSPETAIQDMFRQARIPIPRPPEYPPPADAPVVNTPQKPLTVEGLFRDIAESMGLQRSLWLTVLVGFGVIFIALTTATFGFWWVRRR